MASTRTPGKDSKQKNPGGGRSRDAAPSRGKGGIGVPRTRNAMAQKSEDEMRLAGRAGRDPNDAKLRARKPA